jgi:transcriptional regulator with GAF, ATPase, and Fis domain
MDATEPTWGMVGQSAPMRALFADIRELAPGKAPVVILGERGSGKELVAKALHVESGRPPERYAARNCALLSRELARSELFGHVRGAYTGAVGDRKGLLRETNGGTVFLDEVGELPLDVQAGLLRMVESGEVEPLGGAVEKVRVRLVTATNRDLERWAQEDRFRADLYDRLGEGVIRVPPLRVRLDDLPLLVAHFVDLLNREDLLAIDGLTPAALDLLAAHSWPGNVRELRHVLSRSMKRRRGGVLRPEDLCRPDGTPLLAGPRAVSPAAPTAGRPAPALSLRQQTALWLARERGGVSSGALAEACRISEEVARRELVTLARHGHLRREGAGRATRYVPGEAGVLPDQTAGGSAEPKPVAEPQPNPLPRPAADQTHVTTSPGYDTEPRATPIESPSGSADAAAGAAIALEPQA